MTNNSYGPFDSRPPFNPEPDPRLAGLAPPSPPGNSYGGPPVNPYGQSPPYGQSNLQSNGQPQLYGQPEPYGQPQPYAHPPRQTPLSALPQEPRLYHQMLRGPRRRWWRPVVAALLAAVFTIGLIVAATMVVVVIGLVKGESDLVGYVQKTVTLQGLGPVGFLYLNLSLIVLIPAAGWSIWIAHKIRPRYLSSVAGGLRWRWLARCVAVTLPIWAIYIGLGVIAEPAASSPRPAAWPILLVMVLVLTPLQAAGEEYLFRGWIMQNIGSYFARPLLGLIISVAISTVAFSTAHLSPDPWVLGSIGCLAVTSGIAAWRTGGLEAGIVIHAVNNILVFFTVVIFGGFEDAFVDTETTGTPAMLLTAVIAHGIVLALILWQAKRQGIDRYYRPKASAPAAFAPSGYGPPGPAALPIQYGAPNSYGPAGSDRPNTGQPPPDDRQG